MQIVVGDAANSEAALARLAKLQASASDDVLFTNVGLPGMDGRALAAEARRRHPDLQIVLATGYGGKAEAEDGNGIIHLGQALPPRRALRKQLKAMDGQR